MRAHLPAAIRFYDMRHGNATAMFLAGVPAKAAAKRLGHSSTGLFYDTYAHMLEEPDAEAAKLHGVRAARRAAAHRRGGRCNQWHQWGRGVIWRWRGRHWRRRWTGARRWRRSTCAALRRAIARALKCDPRTVRADLAARAAGGPVDARRCGLVGLVGLTLVALGLLVATAPAPSGVLAWLAPPAAPASPPAAAPGPAAPEAEPPAPDVHPAEAALPHFYALLTGRDFAAAYGLLAEAVRRDYPAARFAAAWAPARSARRLEARVLAEGAPARLQACVEVVRRGPNGPEAYVLQGPIAMVAEAGAYRVGPSELRRVEGCRP